MIGELNDQQIKDFLCSQFYGRLGCASGGQVYIVPMTYVYDDDSLYLHTKEGLKIDLMRKAPQVCFEVDHIENMANWRSVMVWGTFEELQGKEADHALRLLNTKMTPVVTSESFRPHFGLAKRPDRVTSSLQMVVFKIKINQISGRYEKNG